MLTTNIKNIKDYNKTFLGNLDEVKFHEIMNRYSKFVYQDNKDKNTYFLKDENGSNYSFCFLYAGGIAPLVQLVIEKNHLVYCMLWTHITHM